MKRAAGSMGPYLLAACMWYSEADVGPGAEAGSASEGDALIKKNVFLHYVLQHRCGRVQASFASTHTTLGSREAISRDTSSSQHAGHSSTPRDRACSSTSRSSSERLGNHTSGSRSSDRAGGDRCWLLGVCPD